MTSKNWYTKDYNRSDIWTKNFYILKKLIVKPGKICTAKPPHLSLKQSSILLKVLTTASTSRMYVTSTCLWQTWLEYPNAILKEQEILNRKGFPESYDMELLLDFLNQIKNNKSVEIPVYSHEIYDIVPDEKQTILPADFVIVEGINVFQNPQNDSLYMTDFFDFSIYVDAAVDDIESWYIDRFQKLLALAQNDPNNYYYRFTEQPLEEVLNMAHQVWESINLVNLQHYIQPTRNRADLILHKATNHEIDEIYLKR